MARGKRRFEEIKRSIRKTKDIKIGNFTVQKKVTLSMTVFALTLLVATVLNLRYGSNIIFQEHFAEELSERTDGLESTILDDAERIDSLLNVAIEGSTGDAASIGQTISDFCPIAGCQGYFLASNDGTVLSSNFEDADDNEVMRKASLLLEGKGKFCGIVQLPGVGYCAAVGRNVQEGETAAFVVIRSLYDNAYLDALKKRHMIDITIFDGLTRMATTLHDAEGKRMVGTKLVNPEAEKTVFADTAKYHGMAVLGGKDMYVQYEPIVAGDGKVVGILFTGIDASVGAVLKGHITTTVVLGGLLISAILTCLFSYTVRKFMTLPIRDITRAARAIAQNDLTTPVTVYHTGDEIEYLSASIEDMKEALHDTIREVVETSALLKSSSVELSDASLELSDGANRQAASLEEISSSIEQMTANIQQNSENSVRTNKLMNQTNVAVKAIVETSSQNIVASRKIMDSIKSINMLVNQTNILSLNASVEAARAGSHGRGFAVVAREVGRLAEQTKTTANGVNDTAAATVEGTDAINSKLNEVQPQISQVVSLMNEIAANSTEQSVGAEQINTAIMDLNKLTQHAAANAEEIAANAEELAGAAEHLHEAVSIFKV